MQQDYVSTISRNAGAPLMEYICSQHDDLECGQSPHMAWEFAGIHSTDRDYQWGRHYGAHNTIHVCSAIHLPFLAGKRRLVIMACDQKHRTQPTTAACAVMMRSDYNRVSRCSVFLINLLVLLEYTGCYLWYLVFVSNFGMCYNCTLSYRIVLRGGNAICTVASVSPVYRCAGVSFQP